MSRNAVWIDLSARLVAALRPIAAPIGIAFVPVGAASDAPPFDSPYPAANESGRTGAVPAGCVFWMKAVERAFSTNAADHANCSVGSYTHGFITLDEAAPHDDFVAALESGWVNEAAVASMPHLRERPAQVVYGPLAKFNSDPDVVLVRINALSLMILKDAFPSLRIEGKPQCHIIALAMENGEIAASVGCALSRARTGMRSDELTCAMPASRLAGIVLAMEAAADLDRAMGSYAGVDAQRFDAKS
ncbi:MAG: DUF169 domain-containing protein [Candidatus Binatus sp.]